MENAEPKATPRPRRLLWLKRLGVLGFAFFLAKGLLWLSLPALAVWFGTMR